MTPAAYRAKAEEMGALARLATNPAMREECEKLAQSYLRLADQADRNSLNDLTYETPPLRSVQPQPMRPTKDET